MQVLSCKQRCALELASNTNQPFDDFLPSHFNYLQFSYYNSKTRATLCGFGPPDGPNQTPSVFPSPGENLEQAIECAKTFLLFHPDDEVMKDNLAYYSVMLGEDKAEAISPRQVPSAHVTFPLHTGSGRSSSGLLRGCRPRAAAPLGGSVPGEDLKCVLTFSRHDVTAMR